MTCEKNCDCSECEMLQTDEIVFISYKGLREKRDIIPCVKCGLSIKYSLTPKTLKNSTITDNIIFRK